MKVKAASGFARILRRAFDENARGRPAFLEFICSHHPVHGGWIRPAPSGH